MSESLPICKICKRNAADETGSHLLTAWLIASVYDESGRNRDYEIIFNMNEKFFRTPYFGRNILPDKIEDIIGKKKEEIDFKNQKHAFVENHIFCKHCEKRFKIIEDEFLNKIHRKLRLENFSILKNKKYSIQLIDNNLILRLFFYSQIWRVSVTDNISFKISSKLENKIGSILNATLALTLKETLINLGKFEKEIKSIPLIVIKLEKPEDTTKLSVFFHLKYTKPYSILLNDYIILLYEKESHLKSIKQSFFGITDLIGNTELVNMNESSFKLGYIKDKDFQESQKKLIKNQSENDFKDLRKLYRERSKSIFGEYPKEIYFKKFCKSLTTSSKRNGKTITKENFDAAMKNSLE